jgi:hypothetical protein
VGTSTNFRSSLTTDPYPTLHSGAMERLKKFIAELRQQGIYINLNLMVGYAFRPTIDGVPALDDKGTAPAYGSPVHVFFPKMVDLQALHAQRLIAALGVEAGARTRTGRNHERVVIGWFMVALAQAALDRPDQGTVRSGAGSASGATGSTNAMVHWQPHARNGALAVRKPANC